jgi:hypothetical protein
VVVPGVIDSPESRIILDRICEDDNAMQQAAAILSGETGDIVIRCPILLHLLRHVSALPVGGIAAITAPADMRRRAEVAQYLANRIAAGQLSAYEIDGLHRIEHGTYQGFPGRLPGSMFLDAWLGTLTVFSE